MPWLTISQYSEFTFIITRMQNRFSKCLHIVTHLELYLDKLYLDKSNFALIFDRASPKLMASESLFHT